MKTRSSSTLHSEGATAAGSGAPDENRALVAADIAIVRVFGLKHIDSLWKFVEKETRNEIGRSTAEHKEQVIRDLQAVLDRLNEDNAASATAESSEVASASPSSSPSPSGPALAPEASPSAASPPAAARAVRSEETQDAVGTDDSTASANAASAAAMAEAAAPRSATRDAAVAQSAQVDAMAPVAAAVEEDFFGSGPDFETSTRDAARLSCLYGGEFPFVPDGWARGPLPDHAAASEPSSTAMGTGIHFLAALCDETDALDGEAFDDGLLQRGTFINDDPRFYQF